MICRKERTDMKNGQTNGDRVKQREITRDGV